MNYVNSEKTSLPISYKFQENMKINYTNQFAKSQMEKYNRKSCEKQKLTFTVVIKCYLLINRIEFTLWMYIAKEV